jgi:hypothetical protein
LTLLAGTRRHRARHKHRKLQPSQTEVAAIIKRKLDVDEHKEDKQRGREEFHSPNARTSDLCRHDDLLWYV